MRTVTGLSHQPFATAAAAAATALEPEALVSPAPRSQTSTDSWFGPSTRTSWTFVRSGKRSWCSISGPSRSRSSRLASSRTTACGFPTRDRGELDLLLAELDCLGLPHLDLTDPHRDRAIVADRGRVGAAGDADRHLWRRRPCAQPGRRDPAPVAGELRDRAVGVPDHDLGLRVRSRRPPRRRRPSRCRSGRRRAAGPARAPSPPRRRGSCYRARATSRIARF